MKLFYAPGFSSLADHIAMLEAGLRFDIVKVDIWTKQIEGGGSYLEINPKGYVPALTFDDGEVLTENVAILSWVADRAPGEFYQLDVEMSFVTQDDVFAAIEPVLHGVFEEFAEGKPVTPKFPLIPYAEALRSFGTDKPDLRNPLKM